MLKKVILLGGFFAIFGITLGVALSNVSASTPIMGRPVTSSPILTSPFGIYFGGF